MTDPSEESDRKADSDEHGARLERLRAALPSPAKRALDPASPAPLRQMAARGVVPGLKPADAIATVALLSAAPDVAGIAKATLERLPTPILQGALAAGISPDLAHILAPYFFENATVAEKLLSIPGLLAETVLLFAAKGSEAVTELVATNEERLLATPEIIEKLYLNPKTRMSTADRIVELAVRNDVVVTGIPAWKEAALAIGQELIALPSEERTADDVLFVQAAELAAAISLDPSVEETHLADEVSGEERVREKFKPLYAMLADMTVSQKIRRATLGTASERALLVRDTNKLVAAAAVKSPSLQENEVEAIAANRSVSDDVLRLIAQSREWTRSHVIRLRLVQNPRTPFSYSSRLLPLLRDHELRAIAKSKQVPGAVAQAARNHLEKKTR